MRMPPSGCSAVPSPKKKLQMDPRPADAPTVADAGVLDTDGMSSALTAAALWTIVSSVSTG